MARRRTGLHGVLTLLLVAASACKDVVIGSFAATGGGGGSGSGSGSGSGGSSEGGVTTTTTGDPLLPGGCIEESFDAASLDEAVWITWVQGDATAATQDGALTFVPPTAAEISTGLVLNQQQAFPFTAARVEVDVVTPPDPASLSELFLQVTEQVPATAAVLSVGMYQGRVWVIAVDDDDQTVFNDAVADVVPHGLAIAAHDGVADFEIADDQGTWTTVATVDLPSEFAGASPLVMVWNNPGDGVPAPQPVRVDNLSVCAD